MKRELEQKFLKRWPTWFRGMNSTPMESCMAFGMECGNGWFHLIWDLCEDIEDTGDAEELVVDQVKEKFGGLRFYYHGGSDQVNQLVSRAEADSYHICERCGTRENVTSEGRWITTLCARCRKPTDTVSVEVVNGG